MKKLVKVAVKIYALFVGLCVGYAVLLKVTTPKNKTKEREVIEKAIDDAMTVLQLKKHPTISITNDINENYVMAAGGTIHYKGMFSGTITKTVCSYELKVNEKALQKQLDVYYQTFGSKQAVYDSLYLTVCHELRHMWQYESQWFVGKEYNSFNGMTQEMIEGHGSLEEEEDANLFATEMAERKGIKELGEFLEILQRTAGALFVDKERTKELRKKRTEVAKKYNKLLYVTYKLTDR